MDKEQFQNNMMMFKNGIIDYVTFTSRCIQYINSLEAENAKLKKPKTCDGCVFENAKWGVQTHCITCNRDKTDHFQSKAT
ncbi:MAG: hypothetical protein PHI47_06345 [Sulfuricurvum sp.]|uniref:hypothetical protein n=1 Tax=Sulfuricurvum sp. TaxID=2025608 RepID=UPI0026218303|nr:hypothetical protein [Sulfuricurvum sp.]MDD5159653.1 hypothetical protein [Sulfuricurvum sp.]